GARPSTVWWRQAGVLRPAPAGLAAVGCKVDLRESPTDRVLTPDDDLMLVGGQLEVPAFVHHQPWNRGSRWRWWRSEWRSDWLGRRWSCHGRRLADRRLERRGRRGNLDRGRRRLGSLNWRRGLDWCG